MSGDVEKADDLFRVRHARDSEPHGEHDAGDEGTGELSHFHGLGSRCRMKKTASPPVAMNVATATKDRVEKRLRPHTPCPLVQPPLNVLPKPTSSPATAMKPVGATPARATMDPGTSEPIHRPPTSNPARNAARHATTPRMAWPSSPR